MVTRILDSSPKVISSLEYNCKKVEQGVASIVHVNEIATKTIDSVKQTLLDLERLNIRTERTSFHLAVNPIAEDGMEEEQVVRFIQDLMTGLGYQHQPYAVFKHEDIERTHYHVVSVRTDISGRAIVPLIQNKKGELVPYKLDKRLCNKLLIQFQKTYNYHIGETSDKIKILEMTHFRRSKGQIRRQLREIFSLCLEAFVFTTQTQLVAALEHFGVKAKIGLSKHVEGKEEIILHGMENGKSVTRPVLLSDDEVDSYRKRLARNNSKAFDNFQQITLDIERLFIDSLVNSYNESELLDNLTKKGIELRLSRSSNGRIFGLTIYDWTRFMAFKGSDVNKDIRRFIAQGDYSEQAKLPICQHYERRLKQYEKEQEKAQLRRNIENTYRSIFNPIGTISNELRNEMDSHGMTAYASLPILCWFNLHAKISRVSTQEDADNLMSDIGSQILPAIDELLKMSIMSLTSVNKESDIAQKRGLRVIANRLRETVNRQMPRIEGTVSPAILGSDEWARHKLSIINDLGAIDEGINKSMQRQEPTSDSMIHRGFVDGCSFDSQSIGKCHDSDLMANNAIRIGSKVASIFGKRCYPGNEFWSDKNLRIQIFSAEFVEGERLIMFTIFDKYDSQYDRYYISSDIYSGQKLEEMKWTNQFGDELTLSEIRDSIDQYNIKKSKPEQRYQSPKPSIPKHSTRIK